MKPAYHPSHTLWKYLEDSHIPTASTTGYMSFFVRLNSNQLRTAEVPSANPMGRRRVATFNSFLSGMDSPISSAVRAQLDPSSRPFVESTISDTPSPTFMMGVRRGNRYPLEHRPSPIFFYRFVHPAAKPRWGAPTLRLAGNPAKGWTTLPALGNAFRGGVV